jgi:hypothetical protein
VKTENPSACATVKCKLWKSTTALYLNVINRTCNQGANKSNHPNYILPYTRRYKQDRVLDKNNTMDNIQKYNVCNKGRKFIRDLLNFKHVLQQYTCIQQLK